MASTTFRDFQLLLFSLLVLHEMMTMLGEGAICESPSRLFRGACFSSNNCGTICETEGFQNGRCKFFKCICSKDCGGRSGGGGGGAGGGAGGGDGPPSDGPPDGGDSPPDGGDSPPDGGEGPPDDGSDSPPDSPPDGGEGPPDDGGSPPPSDSFFY